MRLQQLCLYCKEELTGRTDKKYCNLHCKSAYQYQQAKEQPERFYNKVENSFEWIEAKREDIFVMSFYAWLKSKMEKQPLFDTTLKLIEQSQNVN